MLIGYARVSTIGQSLEVQTEALEGIGCQKIFSEKQSGKNADDREQLQAALDFCREGDVLVITKLDRLARSMGDLWAILQELTTKGVGFKVLDNEGLDTTTATGKLLLNILGSVAEFERDLINARTAEGRAKAKAKGVKFGRKPIITEETKRKVCADIVAGELSMQSIADKYSISRKTVYRIKDSS